MRSAVGFYLIDFEVPARQWLIYTVALLLSWTLCLGRKVNYWSLSLCCVLSLSGRSLPSCVETISMNCCLVGLGFFWDPMLQSLQSFLQSSAGEAVSWVWNLAAGRILNLILLASRAEELDRETRDLSDLRADLQVEIKQGELENMGPTHQALAWLRDAEEIEARAADFRVSFQQKGASSEGSSLQSSNRIGDEAAECLKQVQRLKTKRSSLPPLTQALPPAVVPLPGSSNYDCVGTEETLSEIARLVLEDDEAGIIGIYGMGGIGKTTLLKAINDKLLQRGPGRFDLVIWVTVSKELDGLKVQEDIAVRLGYCRPGEGQGPTLPRDLHDRASALLTALSQRKFLLLLDDLWEKLDLGTVGVPFPSHSNGSKIVFTTRSLKVCNEMESHQRVKVPLLNRASSWKLFCERLGRAENQWDLSLRSLAAAVAAKCGGLPLTLITVGRAMADATTRGEWKEALMSLKGIPAELGDMKEVLTLLKFSFDRLKDTAARECLLYCALFPEDHNIDISQLIDYCVGEGFLERGRHPDSIYRARNRGLITINGLKAACLLEDGGIKGREVKLHDTVREMALWITSGEEDEKNVFLVDSGERLTSVPTPERWTEATRISFMHNEVGVLPEKPRCHNLRTLLLNSNHPLREIPSGFFQFMLMLRVLDLSRTGIHALPVEIGSLVELRQLNLSETFLDSLPVEVGRLTNLRELRLEDVFCLKSIPWEAVSSLPGLQSLNIFKSYYELMGGWMDGGSDCGNDREGRQLCLKDLDGLGQLMELGLSIRGIPHEDMQALLNSGRLCASIRFLCLKEVGCSSFDLSCLQSMKGLRTLFIEHSTYLEELIFNTNQPSELEDLTLLQIHRATISWKDRNVFARDLSIGAILKNLLRLEISKCGALEDITWIRELPCIEIFRLSRCLKIVELIVVQEVMIGDVDYEKDFSFPKLKEFYLNNLINLRNVCRHPLLFPSLEKLLVADCPVLKKLPFGVASAKNLKDIRGSRGWWTRLEWDHEDVRSTFAPYFSPFF